jgi:rhamnosyltransferase
MSGSPVLPVEHAAVRPRMSPSLASDPPVSIILRSYNEGWALRETLPALRAQDYTNWELIVIDSGSTDGSVDLIRGAAPEHFIQIKQEDYNPSRVMNHGMELARSEFGIFLNADATPQGSDWLRPLVETLRDAGVAAVFGRQMPRPDCRAVYAHDYERCFGPTRESTQWEHFFSMVSSGLRKDIWGRRGFLEKMQYSEDDEYTRWCVGQGYRIVYVPESVVMHSHNYTPQQAYKRSFGEAKALAAVWTGSPGQINFPKTVLLGWANDARRDLLFCSRRGQLRDWPHAARIRWQQRRAKLAGFREGWEFYRDGSSGGKEALIDLRDENGASSRRLLRFTLDGGESLERRLSETCERVLGEVQALVPSNKLEALVLGGGYGRGQGGVLKTDSGDAPYNDLELYVFLRGNRILNEKKYCGALQAIGERLSPEAGLHVEFKVDSLERLRNSEVSMFSYDLVCGHRMLFGDETLFVGCEHHRNAADIAAGEATRLLFNRCTGLLLAKELLGKNTLTPDDADFIGRNIAKAQLALGDAILAASGKYHWDCRERRKALSGLPAVHGEPRMSEVVEHHAAGVDFKLHPRRISKSAAEFRAEHKSVAELAQRVWLWLEGRRLHRSFASAHEYALSPIRKIWGAPLWRNVLLNAKAFGPAGLCDVSALRYPRERLMNALPLLLWEEPLSNGKAKRRLQKELRTGASDWQGFVAAYKAVWPKFS